MNVLPEQIVRKHTSPGFVPGTIHPSTVVFEPGFDERSSKTDFWYSWDGASVDNLLLLVFRNAWTLVRTMADGASKVHDKSIYSVVPSMCSGPWRIPFGRLSYGGTRHALIANGVVPLEIASTQQAQLLVFINDYYADVID